MNIFKYRINIVIMDKYLMYSILELIKSGNNTIDKLCKALNVDRFKIEDMLSFLETSGYVRKRKKGFLIKKEVYELTPSGDELRIKLRREISNEIEYATKLVKEEKREEAKQVLQPMIDYIPLFITFGLIQDMLLLSFLTDFMGLVLPFTLISGFEEGIDNIDNSGESESTDVDTTDSDVDFGDSDVDTGDVDFDVDMF